MSFTVAGVVYRHCLLLLPFALVVTSSRPAESSDGVLYWLPDPLYCPILDFNLVLGTLLVSTI